MPQGVVHEPAITLTGGVATAVPPKVTRATAVLEAVANVQSGTITVVPEPV